MAHKADVIGVEPPPVEDMVTGSMKDIPSQEEGDLHKTLKDRHLSMIAMGGALGTGLLIGTGSALAQTGPGGILVDYSIIGVIVFMVMAALGEMTSFAPMSRGFGGYATRFVDPALGFATGYAYFFKYLLATPNQLSAIALIIEYWTGDKVNPAVWITIALIAILVINFISVKAFGEFEFWLSSFKIIVMTGAIILLLVLALGGGANLERTGFRYWSNPGAFAEYKLKGSLGRVYAYGGTELVAVTVSEAQNPRLAMARAVKLTFFRIVIFYILSVLFLGMVVPYNSSELAFAAGSSTSAAASPFVVAIKLAKIRGLDHVINACLLMFVISAATSDYYIATRTIYNIAADGNAPKILTRTNNRGVPIFAMIIPTAFCFLAYMSTSSGAKVVFSYLTSMVSTFGMLTWISILVTHIYFSRAVKLQKIPANLFAYRAPLREWGSLGGLLILCLLTLTKGFGVFLIEFDYKNFILQYIGLPIYLGCLFGYKFYYRTGRVKAFEADLVTGVSMEPIEITKARQKAEMEESIATKPAFIRVCKKYLALCF
ncbi:Amino acid/polyamine transporter I [Penicillium expansum]|uniref:Amino acid/polyamine transporter I n=1 Tax=Penicillium expansum TaxID=27334 RepID=A0A0A2JNF8_PENEN|nr:Amino acid/polyamine transporter I [Penicillium expansum]KGO42813.1 Amino acid/polyamine transporter I [Penicillium expansum]KGO56934.1 Amino acid/polyamine transporter I [Penicillium expansum]